MDTGQLYPLGSLQPDTGQGEVGNFSFMASEEGSDMDAPRALVTFDPQSLEYDMSGEKHLFTFDLDSFSNACQNSRPCNYDELKLQQTLGSLGFTVHPSFTNLTRRQVYRELEAVCAMNHVNTSCVAFLFLGHGDTEGEMNAAEQTFLLKKVLDQVLYEPSLAGKPKLFFNRACRRENQDTGHRVFCNRRVAYTLPTHSDFLVMTSYEEKATCHSGQGSRFVKALCDVLNDHHQDQDVLNMMTLLNNSVQTKYSTTFTKFLKF